MSLLAQDGYGKAAKINEGIKQKLLSGVIISPRDNAPGNTESFIADIKQQGGIAFLDPQIYAIMVSDERIGHLSKYDYYPGQVKRSFFMNANNFIKLSQTCIEYQAKLKLDGIFLPSIMFHSFNDSLSQIALQLLNHSVDIATKLNLKMPIYASLIFAEEGLEGINDVNEFLNILTQLEVAGFYIICQRTKVNDSNTFSPDRLSNLLWITYSLGVLNNYDIHMGFCDTLGLLLHAFGAKTCASGWFKSLRKFSLSRRFAKSTGGQRPKPRYFSPYLLTHIEFDPGLQELREKGSINSVISGRHKAYFEKNMPRDANWNSEELVLQYWHCLNQVIKKIESLSTYKEKILFLQKHLAQASKIERTVDPHNAILDLESNTSYVNDWEDAIELFGKKYEQYM